MLLMTIQRAKVVPGDEEALLCWGNIYVLRSPIRLQTCMGDVLSDEMAVN